MTSTLQEESDSNAPLDLLEMETLPPLSPRMQRAFLEVFGDEEVSEESRGEETVTLRQDAAWLSPSQEAMTAEWVTTMSPSKPNGVSEEDSVEARRARRSAIEKKSRQRRQGVLGRMRQELKHLESVYAEMAKKQDAAVSNGALSRPHKGSLQHRYTQLSLVTQALKEDRIKLLKLLESHEVFQRTAEAMARRGDGRRRGQEQEGDLIWDTGVPPSSSFTVQIPRRSPAECYELVRETYETIKRFDDGGHFVSTGANFMGWTDKRKLDEARSLQYGFSKTFPLESAEGLLMRTWDVFCHADTMAHLSFNASVATRFEIVQMLGDDLCIIRRDHKFPSMAMNFVTVHIVFRLQTPTGYTLCMRTIPAPEVKSALEPHEFYYDVFHWTHFNQLFDESGQPAGCEISTGGYIADVKQLVSKYWLFELVMSVLRWENMCVAPLFLKL